MVVTIETSSEQELERLLEALDTFEISNVKVNHIKKEADVFARFHIKRGKGGNDFFTNNGIWKDDNRSLEEMKQKAWFRNETYL